MEAFNYNFNRLFAEAKGQPVMHEGRNIVLVDKIAAKYNERFLITIEETNSTYKQGVGISEKLEVFGQPVKRAAILEYFSLSPDRRRTERSRLPFSFEVVCKNNSGYISLYNIAEVDGRIDWFNYACAMIVEDIPNGKRYFCNDFQPNDDFNDIVFTINRLG